MSMKLGARLTTVAVVGFGALVPLPPGAAAQVPSSPNPPIAQACGLDLTLVLDASGSVESANAVEDVRDSGTALLEALTNTNSTARVTQFATFSAELAARTQIDDAALDSDGALGAAMTGYYHPRPPQPGGSDIHSYRGGDPQDPDSFSDAPGSTQWTNWDASLDQAGAETAELVVYVTDGDPTAYNFDNPDDPFGDADVAVGTDSGAAAATTIDRAVAEANELKDAGTRVLAVGVGAALGNPASQGRLAQIAGPQVVSDDELDTIESINEIDVALVEDFADLADFLRGIAFSLCSPSLTIHKLAQHPDDSTYTPEQGWAVTATPTVAGGDFTWVLPDTADAPSKTVDTDGNGFAQFQWSPEPPDADSAVTVAEEVQDDYLAGRPDGDDFRCELRDISGAVRTVSGDFADPGDPSFAIDPIGREIATCTIYNSFDYDPQIAIEKTNAPTELRGDLTPPAEVTSSYLVTNPGNTPVTDPTVTDDRCAPVELDSGDTDGDGLLDPGEQWQYSCSRPVRTGPSTDPAGQNVVNQVEVVGTGIDGTVVTADDEDDVEVFTPAITVEKTANGEDPASVVAGDDVTYTYLVTNPGNTPLAEVALSDDTPPCTAPTLVDNGDGDDVLDVGESWTYECVSPALQEGVVNTATVEATPLNPETGEPFDGANPPVTDQDPAAVAVAHPDLELAKTASPELVLLDQDGTAEPVTYTFTATNTGDDPLAGPDGQPGTDREWITDPRCLEMPTFVDGDTDGDEFLDPGEAWTFTCPAEVTGRTVNVAQITATPTDPDGNPIGDPISAWGAAVVRTVQPGIEVSKTAVRSPVLDPDAPAVSGPDTPAPRPAEYRYEVTNPGQVPLSLDPAPADDQCSPLTLAGGDDGNGLLDPGEVWTYTCQTILEREDSATPPGEQSATVENTVTATGVPFFDGELVPDKAVTDSGTASVTVIEPSLELTKTASTDSVKSGNEVTYTFEVTNTGDTALTLPAVADDRCAPLELEGGDTDGDGLLDGANTTPETWTWTCQRAVFAPDSGDPQDVNTATVTAVGPLGNSYQATDTAAVTVVLPAIQVVKTPSQFLVPAGTEITYQFEVTNVGQSDLPEDDVLEAVALRDAARPALPECRAPELVSKTGGNQDDLLERDPAEVWTYECAAPVSEPTTNVAIVAATGGSGDLEFAVGDFDVARVGVFHPGLNIEKSADPAQLDGPGEVTYTYRVTNTGDVPLANVAQTISDDTCAPVTFVSGDTNGNELLDTADSIFEHAVAETWTFECTTTIDGTTVNTVMVSGSPSGPDGQPLCGPDAAEWLLPTPCDVAGENQAQVRLIALPEPPDLPDTRGMTGLPPMLLLGLLLVLAGAVLVAAGRRAVRQRRVTRLGTGSPG